MYVGMLGMGIQIGCAKKTTTEPIEVPIGVRLKWVQRTWYYGLDRCILYCTLFVFMLLLLCLCVATEFSVNRDLY